jgi:hypothetical protein
MRPDDLDAYIRRSKQFGMQVMVVTSAFWARSSSNAQRVLGRFAAIDFLGLSADAYHEEFAPIANIRNAIAAAKEVGISQITLQIVYSTLAEVERIRRTLGEDINNVSVRLQKLWPVGRAAQFNRLALEVADDLDTLAKECPMGAPVITPDAKIKGCCSALLNLGEDNPLVLGDLRVLTLAEALDESRSAKHYQFLRVFGLGPVVELIRREGLGHLLDERYTDVCHLCHDVHHKPELRHLIDQKIGNTTSK